MLSYFRARWWHWFQSRSPWRGSIEGPSFFSGVAPTWIHSLWNLHSYPRQTIWEPCWHVIWTLIFSIESESGSDSCRVLLLMMKWVECLFLFLEWHLPPFLVHLHLPPPADPIRIPPPWHWHWHRQHWIEIVIVGRQWVLRIPNHSKSHARIFFASPL